MTYPPLTIPTSQGQLLEIARGVEYMHELNIVHKSLKIVYPLLHLHPGHALTSIQTDILIDHDGHARVAGLGVALLPSSMPGVDIDRFFHGAAPELIEPQRLRSANTGATKASDTYAFGALALEVCPALAVFCGGVI
jgi:serine/threonine protein kinase